MSASQTTTDHQMICRWAEERGGAPATVSATASGDDPGVLRIDFPDYSGEDTLEPVRWEQFFEKFDAEGLAFLYQDRTDSGDLSRFCKFVHREEASR